MGPPRRSPEQIAAELKRLQETSRHDRDQLSLLHEISVYQEELNVQNEALVGAQAALEETRDRFIELYDFAPHGYLTLDVNGVVLQCNLTAAALFGRSKTALEGLPLLGFVIPEDRPEYLDFLRRCRRARGLEAECELTLRTDNGERHVQFLSRPRTNARSGAREFLTSLVDVTEHRRLERDRHQVEAERAELAGRLLSVQDDERLRIARNLHDDIGQQVTALRLALQDLAQDLADAAAAAGIKRIQDMLAALDRRLHFVATELRPASLDLGLATALGQFVQEWSGTFSVAAEFQGPATEGLGLSPEVETHIFRIAQEALNNVARHAAARHVTVVLERRHDGIALIVEDDGRGFDVSARAARRLGLVGMRERAQLIGARLELESSPGKGTSVFLHVPLGA